MNAGKSGTADTIGRSEWPAWARRLVTAALLVHVTAVLAGALRAEPSSPLERSVAGLFEGYYDALDQGHTYRYYAPEPGPTPVVTATIRFEDGRPEETVRLPTKGLRPRLRYQRQLALAYHLTSDFEAARREAGDGSRSVWAQSYARHLAQARPGCATVTLYTRSHLIPDPLAVVRSLQEGRAVDLDAEEFYTAPERIGEYPCGGS
jgi:hypothetical protein